MSYSILFDEPIATYKDESWKNAEVTTNVYTKDEYTIIEIITKEFRQVIEFRNVASLNKDAAIQFRITEYSFIKKRTKDVSFSIPLPLCELFIKGLLEQKIN
jgi:hypothetical protein